MSTPRSKKMLFCALDIGGRMELFTNYLRTKYPHHQFKSFSKYQLSKDHYESHYDYQFSYHKKSLPLQYLISTFFFLYTLIKFDIIYIISGENILTRKLLKFELACYKLFGKKIIMNFVGADIRNPDHTRMLSKLMVNQEKVDLNTLEQSKFQQTLCKLAERYADEIIVVSPDLMKYFKRELSMVPVLLDSEAFKKDLTVHSTRSMEDKEKFTILHAPSNPLMKGSPYVKQVFDHLKLNKDWEFILTSDQEYISLDDPPYAVSKYELLKLYGRSDLVIDQVVIGWYGMQAIEALQSGSRVICYIDKELEKYLPSDHSLDIIYQKEELEAKIIELAVEQKALEVKDLEWINKFHNIDRNPTIQKIFKTYLGESGESK